MSKDLLVMTPEGSKKRNNVKVGDMVLTPHGTTTKVITTISLGRKKIWEVELEDGRGAPAREDQLWRILINSTDNIPSEYFPREDEWISIEPADYGDLEASEGLVTKVVTTRVLGKLLELGYPVYMEMNAHDPEQIGKNTTDSKFYYCARSLARRKQLEVWANGGNCEVVRTEEPRATHRYLCVISYPSENIMEVVRAFETTRSLMVNEVVVEAEDGLYLINDYLTAVNAHGAKVVEEGPDKPEPEPEPEEPTNPIIREEWESAVNTPPNVRALKEDGTIKMGTGIRGTHATVANDGVIELTLIPAIPGRKALGPISSDGRFTKTEEGDVSCSFVVTSLEHPLNDVIELYDSITLDVISDGELVQKIELQLHNNGWYNEAGEMLEGTYIDEHTIQEATRVSFFTERGKEHKFVLSANTKEDSKSIEVTVIDEYVEPEVEEPETPVDPEEPVGPEEEPEV